MTNEIQIKLRQAGYKGEFELSELIEACGTHIKLEWFPETKSAFANCCDSQNHEQHGSTPEEAVANLWLALNTKQHD